MQSRESRIKILSEEPILKAIFTMALPVMFGMLVQVFYNLVDTFFIGKMNDVNQLAASNLGFPFSMVLMAFGGIIGVGASSIISRYMGMKKMTEAGHIVGLSCYLLVALGAAFTVLCLAFLNPILILLGARDDVIAPTKSYLIPLISGSAIVMANYALGIMIRSEGAAMHAMTGMMIGSIVNIILNPILIFACGFRIAGSAWATVIANAAGLCWYIWCYARKSILKISFGRHVWKAGYVRGILSIGIPSGLNQGLMAVAGILTNNLAAFYGATILASMGIASKINSLIILLLIGLATGCQPLFGYNYGARNRKRLVSILKTAMVVAVTTGVVMLGLFTLGGKFLIAVFSPIPEVIAQGTFILTAITLSAPFIGIVMICMNCLQALGKGIPSLILSTGRQGLYYIPLLFILNACFGFHGLVFTQPIVDVLMVITSTFMLRHVIRTDPVLRVAD